MPDRIIRDELLRSHRYVTLSSDTVRLLFHHLILRADDLGNAEATTTAIGLAMARHVDAATAAKWLGELNDVDLVRCYVAAQKQYVHIPRFRQRLRYIKGRHPRPPQEIECNELKELLTKVSLTTVLSQTQVRLKSVEVKRSEVKRREVKPLSDSRTANADVARRLLEFLNQKTSHHYRPTPATLKPIVARLAEGYSESDCKAVVLRRIKAWSGRDEMQQYLRPSTLFGAEKFAQYVGEVPPDDHKEKSDA